MKFAYRKEFATEPLAAALRRRGWETIPSDTPEGLLVSGAVDVAFTSPMEVAHAIGGEVDYGFVPGVSITTRGFAGLLKLIFNKGLVSFESIAVKNPKGTETIVAMMILSEKHDIEPRLVSVPAEASLAEMLAAADCALLFGDDAIFNAGSSSLLDLTDEWEDVMESPLTYMVAWGRIGAVPQVAIDELAAARDEAVLTLADCAAQHPQAVAANAFYQRYLRGEISYTLNDAEAAALEAFFRYAFYYAVISDIPAIKFLPDGELASFPAQNPQ